MLLPDEYLFRLGKYATIEERLFLYFESDPITGCWLHTGWKDKDGYGSINYKNKKYKIHRFSYEYFIGPLTNQANHTCPNKNCFNPTHLYDGTQQENMQDAIKLGIPVGRPPKGKGNERH